MDRFFLALSFVSYSTIDSDYVYDNESWKLKSARYACVCSIVRQSLLSQIILDLDYSSVVSFPAICQRKFVECQIYMNINYIRKLI